MEEKLFGGQLQLKVPGGWEDHSVYTFVSSPQGGAAGEFRPNLMVARAALNLGEDVVAFAKRQIDHARTQLGAFKASREGPVELPGAKGYEVVFTFMAPPEQTVVEERQLFAAAGGFVYVITLAALPGDKSPARAEFDKMLKTLRFAS